MIFPFKQSATCSHETFPFKQTDWNLLTCNLSINTDYNFLSSERIKESKTLLLFQADHKNSLFAVLYLPSKTCHITKNVFAILRKHFFFFKIVVEFPGRHYFQFENIKKCIFLIANNCINFDLQQSLYIYMSIAFVTLNIYSKISLNMIR